MVEDEPRAERRPSLPLRRLLGLGWLLLIGLWLVQELIGERHWVTCLMTYAPQWPLIAPPLLLWLWSRRPHNRPLRRSALLATLFAAVVLAGFQTDLPAVGPSGPRTIRVMTWNLGGGRPVERVSEVIERVRPDVICFQERGGSDSDDPFGVIQGLFADGHATGAGGLGVISRYPIRDAGTIELERRERGTFQVVTLDVDGVSVPLVNVHFMTLEQVGDLRGDPEGAPSRLEDRIAIRAAQADEVVMTARLNGPRTIVCGDFNTPARGRVYGQLRRHLVNAFAAGGWGFGYTWQDRLPLFRIDHIFVGSRIQVRRCWVPPSRVSDHRPVVADLSIR